MPSCVLRYCKNNTGNKNKIHGITYHVFPRPDDKKREIWIKFVQRNRSEDTWVPSDSSRICSVHFKDEDKYITKLGRTFLKKSAVPYDETKINESEVPDPLSDSVSDESILDTPTETALKLRLQKESLARKTIAEKLKKIRQENYYLKRKCAFQRKVIKILKKKFSHNLKAEKDLKIEVEVVDLH